MKLQAERLVTYGFSIGLLILVITSIVSYSTARRLIQTNREVYRRQEALRKMETLLSILKDAETGKRGYQLTKNDAYLEPYNSALKRLQPALDTLEASLAEEPDRLADLTRLKRIIAARMELLQRSLDLQRSAPEERQKQQVISTGGKDAMDAIRHSVGAMEQSEQQHLQRLKLAAESVANRAVIVIASGIVLGFALAASLVFLIRANLKARHQARELLQQAHDDLEIRVRERTAELQQTTEQLALKNRALLTTSECNQVLVRATGESELLDRICRVIVDVGGYAKAWVGFTVSEENIRVATVAPAEYSTESVKPSAMASAIESIKSQKPRIREGPDPMIAMPLIAEDYSLGALCIEGSGAQSFDAEEVKLLSELAADLAYGLTTLRLKIDREKAREELQKTQQLFSMFTGNLPGLAWIKDSEGHFVFINRAWERVLHLSNREVIGRTASELWRPEFSAPVNENEQKARSERFPYESIEALPDKQGAIYQWLVVRFSISSESPLMCGIAIDITQRKQAEEERNLLLTRIQEHAEFLEARVAERTSQLEAAKQELEAFSYSVSHDLKAPLRAIDGFSKALLEDYSDKLDEQGKNYLDRVRNATQRMGNLIDDLLALSRVTRKEMQRETIDLAILAHQTVEDLLRLSPNRPVQVEIEPGLVAVADPRLMKIVLDNLVGNSWKFTAHKDVARIELGKMEAAGEIVYYIKDNGVGFDMNSADRLFIPFQRLHSPQEFEGTGIGLATVQRIIRRHEGRVWCEAKPGEGAVFYFTLADRKTHKTEFDLVG